MIRLGYVDTPVGPLWASVGRIRVEAHRAGASWHLSGEVRNTNGNWVPFDVERGLSDSERASLVAMCEAASERRAA